MLRRARMSLLHNGATRMVSLLSIVDQLFMNRMWTRIYEKLKELGCDPQYYPTNKYMTYGCGFPRRMDKGKYPCYDSRIGLRSSKRQSDVVQSYWATQRAYGQKFVYSSSLSNSVVTIFLDLNTGWKTLRPKLEELYKNLKQRKLREVTGLNAYRNLLLRQ